MVGKNKLKTFSDIKERVVAASAKPLLGFFPAKLGELLALREGLLLAKELNLIIEWVELDVVNIVARIFGCDVVT
ncbi:hypothetical protein ACOSP7_003935 [Xanthoceras sorbifolium]